MKRGFLFAIELYQRAISPYLPVACRYHPTCSHYSHQAISRYGASRGLWLGLRRLARCTPMGGRGPDPVP
ncbi:MAG: protein yidD [Dehalococcoidia bacterium]|nr:protein yidD [Dehalococcoidia bacterium]